MRYRSAFITGATSGIGRALSLELGKRGTFVHAVGRRQELLESLVQELPAGGLAHVVDVTDREGLKAAMAKADASADAPGGLDLVIANAGIAENGIDATDPADAALRILAVNSIAAAQTLEFGFEAMRARRRGQLVAVSSLAGIRGLPGARAYCASKAALSRYVESMRFELKGTGLSVTDVQPGFIKTPMTDRNGFAMPFLMEVEDAARRTVKALERSRPPRVVCYPRRLAWPFRAATAVLPAWAWERLLR